MAFWETLLLVVLLMILLVVIFWTTTQWSRFMAGRVCRTPLIIAEERYARGEIDQAELEEIKGNLSHR